MTQGYELEIGGYLSATRVIHDPKQVQTPDELLAGRTYIRHYRSNQGTVVYRIVSVDKGRGWFEADEIHLGGEFRTRVSMHDMGILPYESGLWNSLNWLVEEKEEAD